MAKTREILLNTRNLIADREHWTYGSHAQSRDGSEHWFSDPEAYCFCLDGALARMAGVQQNEDGDWLDTSAYDPPAELLRESAFELFGTRSYVAVNDGEDGTIPNDMDMRKALSIMHLHTMQVLDRAISKTV